MRVLITFFVVFLFAYHLKGQTCDTNSLVIHKVSASILDPTITPYELVRHHAFYNADCVPKNKLVFYIMGTYAQPNMSLLFTKTAANNGFHVISVNYPNNQSATSSCQDDLDANCYKFFHEEVLFGTDVSDTVQVDTANSIYTRSVHFLNHLASNYPSENWSQFMNGNAIDWTKVIVAGHSQGAGHAAYLAHFYPVQRAILMSGPNEYMNEHNSVASWFFEPSITADSNYYGFANIYDEVSFSNQLTTWGVLGANNYGDSVTVVNNGCPYNYSHMLYTNELFSGGITPNHNCTAVDNFVPFGGNGVPEYEEAWKYMLGVCDVSTNMVSRDLNNDLSIYPTPADQTIMVRSNQPLTNVRLTISNALGKIVWMDQQTSLRLQQINVNDFSSGIYFITIDAKEMKETRKLIIQ